MEVMLINIINIIIIWGSFPNSSEEIKHIKGEDGVLIFKKVVCDSCLGVWEVRKYV
jgi:hypothetical protein